jgi:CspA family cold shock protein
VKDGQVKTAKGRVKWFDPNKGFGFVTAREVDGDILLHSNVLKIFGQSTVADEVGITFRYRRNDKGKFCVTEVVSIGTASAPAVVVSGVEAVTTEMVAALPLEPARVKWFDPNKGFGFANVFGRPEDVFIHVEVLRASGLSGLASSEAVALRIVDGQRGRMAVAVLPWDRAISKSASADESAAVMAAE